MTGNDHHWKLTLMLFYTDVYRYSRFKLVLSIRSCLSSCVCVIVQHQGFPLAFESHTVTAAPSELSEVSEVRALNWKPDPSLPLFKQFHHPIEDTSSVFLKAARFCPPSISKPLTLSISPQVLFPPSGSVFYPSPSLFTPFPSRICALEVTDVSATNQRHCWWSF